MLKKVTNIMTVTVSVVNLTSLGWILSQSTGLNLAAKSVVRANEAVAADRQKKKKKNPSRDQKRVDVSKSRLYSGYKARLPYLLA